MPIGTGRRSENLQNVVMKFTGRRSEIPRRRNEISLRRSEISRRRN